MWGQDSDYSLIATIKYNADGQPLWVQRYDEPPGVNAASAIAVDGQGNVYVTGSATIKYNPDGQELWVRRSPGGFTIKVDGQGNVYVTGSATVKYSPDGQEIWVRRFKGPGNGDDYATAMAVDGQGNVYVTGFSKGSGTGHDYATIKYSPNGQRLWLRRYNGPGNSSAEPSAIAVDGLGNVYVTGLSYVNGTSAYTTIKYSPDGQRLWVKRYAGPNGTSYANAITVDGHGNVYVTGEEYGGIATSWNCTTIKYRSDGRRLWIRRHNGPTNNADLASAIAVDGQGNVYISGRSYFSDDISDYLTIKYKQNP